MAWSKEQVQAHEENARRFREAYVKGENRISSVEDIVNDGRRCVSLINPNLPSSIGMEMDNIEKQLSGLYVQEIPHFTIDCHRYLTEDQLPSDINEGSLDERVSIHELVNLVMNDEEIYIYSRVLFEEFGKESVYGSEVKGVAFGGDGLIAQVWYDDKRMIDFTGRLGERVRQEVPSMDFQWGMVKNKVPLRVVNLTRFTGEEDKKNVMKYVDENKEKEFGDFLMHTADLILSDYYIQRKNTLRLHKYLFSEFSKSERQ